MKFSKKLDITIKDPDLKYYCDKLSNNDKFSFVKYGDGEWFCMLGAVGGNSDRHQYFPKLGEDLRNCVLNPLSYIYGIGVMGRLDELNRNIKVYLKSNNIDLDWYDADIFHNENLSGNLFPLIEELRKKDIVMVGPNHLRKMESIFPIRKFIEIPLVNCYLVKDQVERDILEAVKDRESVCLFSASMATNVMVHSLYPIIGQQCWMIDCGSLWDIYVGVKSRNSYKTIDWGPIIRKNLNEKEV
jgi:hypothetical protein